MATYDKICCAVGLPEYTINTRIKKGMEILSPYLENYRPCYTESEMYDLLEKGKEHHLIEYFFINLYKHHMPPAFMNKLIDQVCETNVDMAMTLLKNHDLMPEQIDKLINAYEKTGRNFGHYLEDHTMHPRTQSHIFATRQADMEGWNFAPYKYFDDKNLIEDARQLINYDTGNEKFNIAVINNVYIPDEIRDKAFDSGCNMQEIDNVTDYIARQIYTATADCAFELDYKFEHAVTIDNAIKILKFHMLEMPSDCILDCIERIQETKKHEYLLKQFALRCEHPDVIKKLCSLKDETLIEQMKRRAFKDIRAYKEIKPYLDQQTARLMFMKMIWKRPCYDHNVFMEWLKPEDIAMSKAILMSPCLPYQVLNKIQSFANPELDCLINIYDKLGRTAITETTFRTYQYFILQTIGKNEMPFTKSIAGKELEISKRPVIMTLESAEDLMRIVNLELKNNHNQEELINIFTAYKKLKETYEEQKGFCNRQIRCLKNTRSGLIFTVDGLLATDKLREGEGLKTVQNMPLSSLKTVKDLIKKGIIDASIVLDRETNENLRQIMICKVANLYNKICDRIEELEREEKNVKNIEENVK